MRAPSTPTLSCAIAFVCLEPSRVHVDPIEFPQNHACLEFASTIALRSRPLKTLPKDRCCDMSPVGLTVDRWVSAILEIVCYPRSAFARGLPSVLPI